MFGGARIEGQGNGQHKATSAVSKRAHAAQRRAREGVEREESPSGEVRGWMEKGRDCDWDWGGPSQKGKRR